LHRRRKSAVKLVVAAFLTVCVVAMAACGPAAASVAAPEIPKYGAAQVVTEVNISEQDILGFLQMAMLAFGTSARGAEGEVGRFVQAIDLETLANALSDLKYVRILQFHLAQPAAPADVLAFYAENIGPGWHRIVWDVSQPGRGSMVLVQPGLTELMVVGVMPTKQAKHDEDEVAQPEPAGQTIAIIRTIGMVNLEKFAAWAGNAVAQFSRIEEDKRREKEAAKAAAAEETSE
jgi:hypothetical protein